MQNLIAQKGQQQQRRGVAAVEFAFIAPMLLAIVLGMIEMTRVYDTQYLLQTAAREGARFAAMDREGLLANGETGNSKLTSDVTNFLASAGIPSGDVQVNILDHVNPTQAFDIDDPANDLRLFKVEITVPFSSVSYTPISTANDYNLTGSITFRNGRATLSQ